MFKPPGQMLLPIFYQMADDIAIVCVAGGRPLNCMLQHLKMADVITKWQDGTTTLYSIKRWQMLLPGGRWNNHFRVGEVLGR